jgi:hypothetical protein
MDSISAQFDENLAFHFIVHVDMEAPNGRDQKLAHGYVLEDGERYGIQNMEISSVRLGVTIAAMTITATDTRGKVYRLNAMANVGAPWNIYATTTYTAMMRWTLGDRVGYGVVMEVLPIQALTRLRGLKPTDWPAAITTG